MSDRYRSHREATLSGADTGRVPKRSSAFRPRSAPRRQKSPAHAWEPHASRPHPPAKRKDPDPHQAANLESQIHEFKLSLKRELIRELQFQKKSVKALTKRLVAYEDEAQRDRNQLRGELAEYKRRCQLLQVQHGDRGAEILSASWNGPTPPSAATSHKSEKLQSSRELDRVLSDHVSSMSAEKEKLQTKLAEAEVEIGKLKAAIQTLAEEKEELSRPKHSEEIENLKKEKCDVEAELASVRTEKEELATRLKVVTDQIADSEVKAESLSGETEKLRTQMAQHAAEKARMVEEAVKFRSQLEESERQIASLTEQNSSLSSKLSAAESEVQQLQTKVSEEKDSEAAAKQEYTKLEEKLSKTLEENISLHEKVAELAREKASLLTQSTLQADDSNLKTRVEQLSEQLADMATKYADLSSLNLNLRNELDQARASLSSNGVAADPASSPAGPNGGNAEGSVGDGGGGSGGSGGEGTGGNAVVGREDAKPAVEAGETKAPEATLVEAEKEKYETQIQSLEENVKSLEETVVRLESEIESLRTQKESESGARTDRADKDPDGAASSSATGTPREDTSLRLATALKIAENNLAVANEETVKLKERTAELEKQCADLTEKLSSNDAVEVLLKEKKEWLEKEKQFDEDIDNMKKAQLAWEEERRLLVTEGNHIGKERAEYKSKVTVLKKKLLELEGVEAELSRMSAEKKELKEKAEELETLNSAWKSKYLELERKVAQQSVSNVEQSLREQILQLQTQLEQREGPSKLASADQPVGDSHPTTPAADGAVADSLPEDPVAKETDPEKLRNRIYALARDKKYLDEKQQLLIQQVAEARARIVEAEESRDALKEQIAILRKENEALSSGDVKSAIESHTNELNEQIQMLTEDLNRVEFFGQLIEAADNGDLEKVKSMINVGCPVDYTNVYNETALMLASEEGFVEIVEYLLSRGARVSSTDSHGRTPLHYAAATGKQETVLILLQHGASTTTRSEEGLRAEDEAAIYQRDDVRELFQEWHETQFTIVEKAFQRQFFIYARENPSSPSATNDEHDGPSVPIVGLLMNYAKWVRPFGGAVSPKNFLSYVSQLMSSLDPDRQHKMGVGYKEFMPAMRELRALGFGFDSFLGKVALNADLDPLDSARTDPMSAFFKPIFAELQCDRLGRVSLSDLFSELTKKLDDARSLKLYEMILFLATFWEFFDASLCVPWDMVSAYLRPVLRGLTLQSIEPFLINVVQAESAHEREETTVKEPDTANADDVNEGGEAQGGGAAEEGTNGVLKNGDVGGVRVEGSDTDGNG